MFYRNTSDRKGSAYLNRFFSMLGERCKDSVVLIYAEAADPSPVRLTSQGPIPCLAETGVARAVQFYTSRLVIIRQWTALLPTD